MSKRDEIIQLADMLIRQKGYNAFSFYDISNGVGIRPASVHYHFPAKSDLGIAVIERHLEHLNTVIADCESASPVAKLDQFLSIYSSIQTENSVCLVGALATDFNTLDENVQTRLKAFTTEMLNWVSRFLDAGRAELVFSFEGEARTKALLILANMLAIVQLSRLTTTGDFETIKNAVRSDLLKN